MRKYALTSRARLRRKPIAEKKDITSEIKPKGNKALEIGEVLERCPSGESAAIWLEATIANSLSRREISTVLSKRFCFDEAAAFCKEGPRP